MKQTFKIAGVEGFIEGEGTQTLVMIHGWPDTYRIWDKQVEFFKQYFRCVTFTLPGYSEHEKNTAYSLQQVIHTIRDVVDFVSPDQPVILMLHDWGCFFGYQYAMQYADRVKQVIAVDVGDANSGAFKKSLTPKHIGFIMAYQLPLATAWKIGGKAGQALARSVAKVLKAPADPQWITANMGYPYFIQWTGRYGSYRQAAKVKLACPVLYIYGKHKPIQFQSDQWLDQLQQQPHNKVVGFNTSHWVMVEQPQQFNQTVYDWLTNKD